MGFHAAEAGVDKVFRHLTCRLGGATDLNKDCFYEAAGILIENGDPFPLQFQFGMNIRRVVFQFQSG